MATVTAVAKVALHANSAFRGLLCFFPAVFLSSCRFPASFPMFFTPAHLLAGPLRHLHAPRAGSYFYIANGSRTALAAGRTNL